MLETRHRTPVSLSLRRQEERVAARALLRSHTSESGTSLDSAAERLWRHARRTMNPSTGTQYVVFVPDMSAEAAEDRTRLEETVAV